MGKYNHSEIEEKWSKIWEKSQIYQTQEDNDKPKWYNLVMFPYPSGDLHIGHWYNFSGGDFYARYMRMNGYNVLNPIGFDSFGLPAENAAIKRNIAPKTWTYSNIENMKRQLARMGASYDWSKLVVTSDPEYYKWTQWMFLNMYKNDLAYKKKQVANWCPSCNTVLANEQVVAGRCERCDSEVVQKEIDQWLLRITKYSQELLEDLVELDWPDKTKLMQANWIGRSEGARVTFDVAQSEEKIEIFTTRIDTIYGATFMVLAPENPMVERITTAEYKKKVQQYIEKTLKKTELDRMVGEKEKTGVFTGSYAVNPVNGEQIPIWISDYVLMGYGTGAIMAVPAHDERDFEFAKKFNLPIREVIVPEIVNNSGDEDTFREGQPISERKAVVCIVKHWTEDKYLGIHWTANDWQGFVIGGIEGAETAAEAGLREISEETGYKNIRFVRNLGGQICSKYYQLKKKQNRVAYFQPAYFELENEEIAKVAADEQKLHRLHWLTSKDMEKFLNREDMRLIWSRLNKEELFTAYGALVNSGKFDGLRSKEAQEKIIEMLAKDSLAEKKVNFKLRDWLVSRQRYWGAPIPIVYCEKCGEVPVADKDLPVLLPEEVNIKPTGESPLKYDENFLNTTCPKCGGKATRETDTLDTFMCSSWYYYRYLDAHNEKEFAAKEEINKWMPVDMYIGGAEHSVLHLLYSRFFTKVLRDTGFVNIDEPFKRLRHQGMILGPDGLKMSKSKGNVIDPDKEVDQFGADAVRMYLAFMAPYDQGGPWNPQGLVGVRRFLDKFYDFVSSIRPGDCRPELVSGSHEIPDQARNDTGKGEKEVELVRIVNKLVKKIGSDLKEMKFNTCISAFMESFNALVKIEKELPIQENNVLWRESLANILIVIAPFAPYLSEELYFKLGFAESVHLQSWPSYDEALLKDEMITIAVQINGKVRDQLLVAADLDQERVLEIAKDSGKVMKYLANTEIVKVIYVRNKLLSIVTK